MKFQILAASISIQFKPGTVAEWVRASALSHSEWMVLSSNPGEGRNFSLLFELGMVN